MRDIRRELLTCLILIGGAGTFARSVAQLYSCFRAPHLPLHRIRILSSWNRNWRAISSDLAVTHQQLEQSQHEMEQLRQELAQIKKLLAATPSAAVESPSPGNPVDTAKATAAAIEDLQERQQTTEAQVKLHDQTKVESSSKYPLHVTGLILFNSFLNRGSVDNIDLPEAALSNQNNTTGNGSAGATFRQTNPRP